LGRDEREGERVAEVEDESREDFDLLGDDGSFTWAAFDLSERGEVGKWGWDQRGDAT